MGVRALGLVLLLGCGLSSSPAHGQSVRVPEQPPRAETASAEVVETRWFTCTLGGKPCGGMESTSRVEEDRRIITSALRLVLRRDDSQVESGLESKLIEQLDGTPMEMAVIQELGGSRIERRWLFLPNRIREVSVQGRRKSTRLLPMPTGTWYSTARAQRLAMEAVGPETTAGNEDEPVFTGRVLDPSLGESPVSTRYFFLGRETLDTPNGAVDCTRWRIEQANTPSTTEWLDGELGLVQARTELGGGMGEIEMRWSSRKDAEADINAPEIMISTAVTPTVPKGMPLYLSRASRLRMRISTLDGAPLDLPSVGAQRVDEHDSSVVVVDVDQRSPADDFDGDWLASTPFADTGDEEIQRFARRGAGHRVEAEDQAEAIRRAVNRHINLKNLGTAFASASDTVRRKTGDCTEHAVLLTAALRAQNIPARVVNGLVWARNVSGGRSSAFVWHMWTQALIDGEWRDLDATITGPKPFHAAHLAVSVNDLSTESFNRSATEMLELLGNLEIEVLPEDGGTDR